MPAHSRDHTTPEPLRGADDGPVGGGDLAPRPRHAAPDDWNTADPGPGDAAGVRPWQEDTPAYDGGRHVLRDDETVATGDTGATGGAGIGWAPTDETPAGEAAAGEVPDGEVSPTAAPGFDLEDYLEHTEVSILEPRYKVSPKAPIAWTLESMWSIIILVALQVGWYFWGDNVMAFWNWVAAAFTAWVGFFSLFVAPTWRYFVARWDFSDTAVFAKSGWWTHQYRIAPLSRLQTVYTKRSMFERMLGLASVIASTASSHGSVEIKGLPLADAETLADHLLTIAEIGEGDAT